MASAAIGAPRGTAEFFTAFEQLRQEVEPTAVQEEVYAYDRFARKAVLDVGCGNGYTLSHYARCGAQVFGLDLTSSALDLSRKRFALDGLDCHLVQGDAEWLPFPDRSFDLVVSAGVLHHTPHIETAIAEIHRVLKPSGTIILMLYHRNSLDYRLLYPLCSLFHPSFRGMWPAEIARCVDGADNPIGRTYTRREVRRLLASFHDVRLLVRSLSIRRLNSLPGGNFVLPLLTRRLGWFLYARAVK